MSMARKTSRNFRNYYIAGSRLHQPIKQMKKNKQKCRVLIYIVLLRNWIKNWITKYWKMYLESISKQRNTLNKI